MQKLIEKLLEETDEGICEMQLTMRPGRVVAGAVRRDRHGLGLYELLTVCGDPQKPGKKTMAIVYFSAEDVWDVAVPAEEGEQKVVSPGPGIYIPGQN